MGHVDPREGVVALDLDENRVLAHLGKFEAGDLVEADTGDEQRIIRLTFCTWLADQTDHQTHQLMMSEGQAIYLAHELSGIVFEARIDRARPQPDREKIT